MDLLVIFFGVTLTITGLLMFAVNNPKSTYIGDIEVIETEHETCKLNRKTNDLSYISKTKKARK